MADLVDMKRSAAEVKAEYDPKPSDAPAYPWGTRLSLGNEEMKKLGIKGLTAGQTLSLTAVVEVVGTSSHTEVDGDERHSCELQITKMALGLPNKPDDLADKLYGGK